MAQSVSTLDLRISFTETDNPFEYGDGTNHPMLVTKEQLAEILYQVKDARFTSGLYTCIVQSSGFTDIDHNHYPPLLSPPTKLIEEGNDMYNDGTNVVWETNRAYRVKHSGSSDLVAHAQPFFDPVDYSPSASEVWKDTLDDPRTMWLPQTNEINGAVGKDPDINDGLRIRTGFTQYSFYYPADASEALPAEFTAYAEVFRGGGVFFQMGMEMSLGFLSEVKWVKGVGGSDNPFDPLNEMYMGVGFSMQSDAYPAITTNGDIAESFRISTDSTFADLGFGDGEDYPDLVFRLASGDATCRLYVDNFTAGEFGQDIAGEDLVIEPTELWEYQAP